MHPGEEGHTWFSGDGSMASRIDYFFIRDCALTDARLSPVFFSDHLLLSCTLSLPSGATTGRGLWKLNRSLLEDQVLVGQYRERYREWQTLQDLYETRAQWWEMVKGPGTSDSSARSPVWRRLHRLVQREPSRPSKQTPGPVIGGGSWDPAGQSRYALPRHGCNVHLPPTRLWRAGVGEAPAVGVQRCCGPVGEGRLLAIPTLASKGGPPWAVSAVRGEPAENKEKGLC
ncbi:uncharacterized protein LOC114137147 [Xiphophorus couchianus]|uniref:uncharacterized protein LOC114137147 n=1 Tax=Xiphophorus couchianus TaxID=32473 RepID=UPI0010171C54|nr:uncharacterized protein LOC114137147 [Xiphophorus couchianus]